MTDELSRSIWIDAPPEIVFPYFVEAEKLARWTGEGAEVDPVPGGVYRLDMGNAGVITAQIVAIEPPRFLSYQVVSHGAKNLVEIDIVAEAGGSRVRVSHAGLVDPFATVAARGWDHHLARLSVIATGGAPGPDTLCARPMDTLI